MKSSLPFLKTHQKPNRIHTTLWSASVFSREFAAHQKGALCLLPTPTLLLRRKAARRAKKLERRWRVARKMGETLAHDDDLRTTRDTTAPSQKLWRKLRKRQRAGKEKRRRGEHCKYGLPAHRTFYIHCKCAKYHAILHGAMKKQHLLPPFILLRLFADYWRRRGSTFPRARSEQVFSWGLKPARSTPKIIPSSSDDM